MIGILKAIISKPTGLNKIPPEQRDAFVKEIIIPLAKKAVLSYVKSGGKDISVTMKKKF